MSRLADQIIDLPLTDDLNEAVDAAIRTAGGDERVAIKSLILGQRTYQDEISRTVSAGYVRRALAR